MKQSETYREQVAQRIFRARLDAGLTLDGLAAKIGTSRQHLIKLEQGKHLPQPRMFAAIAEATGTDLGTLKGEHV